MGPQYRDVKVILSIMGTALIILGSALLGISDKSYNISVFITTAFFLENAYWAFIEWNVLQFAKEKSKIISHTVLSVISTVMVVYCAINEIGISAY
jgi:hypothetical protein